MHRRPCARDHSRVQTVFVPPAGVYANENALNVAPTHALSTHTCFATQSSLSVDVLPPLTIVPEQPPASGAKLTVSDVAPAAHVNALF